MKKLNITILCVAFAAFFLFANLGRKTEISDYDIVSGIAIDRELDKWTVTCEIVKSTEDSSYGSKSEYVKGEGYTLENAFKNASDKSLRILYTDAVRIFIVSSALKNAPEVKEYFSNNEINMRAVAVYSEGQASALFEQYKNSDETKSIFYSDKIRRFCFDIKKPVPKIIGFIRGDSTICLSAKGTPERTDYEN